MYAIPHGPFRGIIATWSLGRQWYGAYGLQNLVGRRRDKLDIYKFKIAVSKNATVVWILSNFIFVKNMKKVNAAKKHILPKKESNPVMIQQLQANRDQFVS